MMLYQFQPKQKSHIAIHILLCLLLFSCISQAKANIVRGPYVQLGTQNSMIIRWETTTATTSQVKYGAAVNNLLQSKTDLTPKTTHIIKLDGLMPLTRYYYSIGTNTQVLAGNDADTYFETSPETGQATPTRIWVVGDPGRAGTDPDTLDQQYVLNGYKTFNNNQYTDFWLMLGDNAYDDGTITEYQNAVFNQYPTLLKQSPLWPAMGNHDMRSTDVDTQTGGFYDLFSTPTQGEAGGAPSNHKAYYSFDYGETHVVVLNSSNSEHNQLTGPMDEWLEADLSQTDAQWIIAIFHHAPYGKSGHDSDTESGLVRMRENFIPILEKYGVDLVMAGHNHYYTRTRLMAKHYGLSNTFNAATHVLNPGNGQVADDNGGGDGAYIKQARAPHSGTVYITHGAGSGGGNSHARLVTQEDIDNGKRHPSDYVYGGRGSIVIDVIEDDMKVNVISPQGEVLDHFTIRHQAAGANQTPVATANVPATAASYQTITFDGTNSSDADGTITHYHWNFGDGNSANVATANHSYTTAGSYTATLTVTDNGGLNASTSSTITVTSSSVELENGNAVSVSGEKNQSKRFALTVPDHAEDINISITGGTGDADLYVKFNAEPTKSDYDCRPYKGGNNESCVLTSQGAGTYYIMTYGYKDYADVSLTGSYIVNTPADALPDACINQSPITDGRLQDGEAQCLGDDNSIWLSIGKVTDHQSIAITTGHGTGNLDIEFSNQGWPNGDNVDASSAGSNNNECIWLQNLDEYWGYIKVTGSNGSGTIIVDFDTQGCRAR